MNKETDSKYLYFCVIAINLAGLTAGTAFAWTSPNIPRLNGHRDPANNPLPTPITLSEESLIASLLAVGAFFSPFLASTSDKTGRKISLLLATTIIYIGFIVIACAEDVNLIFLARFLCGFSLRWYFVIIPNYVAEIAEKHNRGSLSCMMISSITLGNLLIYSVGPYLPIKYSSLILLIPPTVLFVVVWFFVPESPYHLANKGDIDSAKTVLIRLRRRREVEEELTEIIKSVGESKQFNGNIFEIFRDRLLFKCLLITVGLVTFQQFSGVNAIMFYLQTIFSATGTDLPPEISTILVGIVQFASTHITPFFVDKLGRRFLLFISGIGTLISLSLLSIFFHISASNYSTDSIFWLPIVSLITFITTYSFGLGPLPFTILSEIFPPHAKSAASTITIVACFVLTFVTTFCFPYVMELIGIAESFWIFAACCALSLVFTYFCVPETKMKSFAEIQEMLKISSKENYSENDNQTRRNAIEVY